MRKIRNCICALCVAAMGFVTPMALTVGATPHPDHPGHVQGIS